MLRTLLFSLIAIFAIVNAEASTIRDVEVLRDGTTVMISWSAIGNVDVLWSSDPEAVVADMELLTENDSDGIFAITDLQPDTRYYFYLRHQDDSGVRAAARLLPLEGGRNFRDLGGYTTTAGNIVKWGRVFRSGHMADLTPGDYQYLSGLGIRVVCDYRSTEQRAAYPTNWAAGGIEYLTREYTSDTDEGSLRAMLTNPQLTPEFLAENMAAGYYDGIEEHKESYSKMFHKLAEGNIPLAFNCSAGKDRAGRSAALVLAALGVPREQIIHDYSLSELYVDYLGELSAEADHEYAFFADMPAEMVAPFLRSDPRYIANTLDYLESEYGGIEGYLEEALGIDAEELASIRANLLEY